MATKAFAPSEENERSPLRVISFNIHGAKVPGKASKAQQERSWHLLSAYGADVALVQEAQRSAIPTWAYDYWTLVTGESTEEGFDLADWGSVIACRKDLNLKLSVDLLDNHLLRLIFDYVIVGEITTPDNTPTLIAGDHAPTRRLADYLKMTNATQAFSQTQMDDLAQPSDEPWMLDLVFHALVNVVDGHRFIVGGDWNNSRLFDSDRTLRKKKMPPVSTTLFTRA